MSNDVLISDNKFFEPKLECRLFCDRVVLNYFGYNIATEDIIGFSGGPTIYYFLKQGENPFFTLYGKSISSLKNISYLISGNHYAEYNGTVEDLELILTQFRAPVIVEVDFNLFYENYPAYLKTIIKKNLNSLMEYHIMPTIPHQVLVLGANSESFFVADNMTSKVVEISRELFSKMWSVSYFQFPNTRKSYMEYILTERKEKRAHPLNSTSDLKVLLNKFLWNMLNENNEINDSEAINSRAYYGLNSILQFKEQLLSNAALPTQSWEFSVKMIYDFDKYFSLGMYRKNFAKFINRSLLLLEQNGEKFSGPQRELYKGLTKELEGCSTLWQSLIKTLTKWDKVDADPIKDSLDTLYGSEKRVTEMVSEILAK